MTERLTNRHEDNQGVRYSKLADDMGTEHIFREVGGKNDPLFTDVEDVYERAHTPAFARGAIPNANPGEQPKREPYHQKAKP